VTGLDLSSIRSRARPRPADVAFLVLALVTLAWVIHALWDSRAALERARRDRGETQAQVAAIAGKVGALEGRSERQPGIQGARMALAADAPPQAVVQALASLLPPDVRLLDLGLTYDQTLEVEMRVVARRAAAYDLFLERLHGSPLLSSIVPGPEARDGEVSASVRAEYRPRRP
jgi:hypothetical protein